MRLHNRTFHKQTTYPVAKFDRSLGTNLSLLGIPMTMMAFGMNLPACLIQIRPILSLFVSDNWDSVLKMSVANDIFDCVLVSNCMDLLTSNAKIITLPLSAQIMFQDKAFVLAVTCQLMRRGSSPGTYCLGSPNAMPPRQKKPAR
jgi:hypothetical protein